MDLKGELVGTGARGGRSTAVRGPVRLLGGRREPTESAEGRAGADLVVQQIRGVVRGTRGQWIGWVGALQLRDAREFAGEAFLVPWTDFEERRRILAQLRHQREFPRARE